MHRALSAAVALVAVTAIAQAADELRNWFGDPFFQVSSDIAGCPQPLGPFATEAERRVQSHHRAEKGTTCWLAGQCERPNYYEYDASIAQALRGAVAHEPRLFERTSLWVTVQGRTVYIEGCVPEAGRTAQLEAFARGVPHVQQAIASVRDPVTGRVPYRVMPTRPASPR